MMRPKRFVILIFLILISTYGSADGSRDDAFIGYSERLECQDRLDHCQQRSKHDGCLTDPYSLRIFCPIACAVSKCMSTGTLKVRHSGFATEEDTRAFAQRWAARAPGDLLKSLSTNLPSHFRIRSYMGHSLTLSSLGIGTYLGDIDSRTDDAVAAAVIYSVMNGWNVIDTASNYRLGRAESSIGAALDSLLAGATTDEFLQENEYMSDITRSMLFISTKAGFTDEAVVQTLIQARKLSRRDVVQGHTLSPTYLLASVNASLERLNLKSIDLLYLHNAAEMQLQQLGKKEFKKKLKEAFVALELLITSGAIRSYGLATWDCFRVPPSDAGHVSLEEVVSLAKEAAGNKPSGFAAIQLPVSATMPEAWLERWQQLGNESVSLMEAAKKLGLAVFTSGPLGEGELLRRLSSRLDPVFQLRRQPTTATKLLQLARSTPGAAMTAALVGHKTREFVEANCQLSLQEPLQESEFREAMKHVKIIIDGAVGNSAGAQ